MSSERKERSGSFWSPPNLTADSGPLQLLRRERFTLPAYARCQRWAGGVLKVEHITLKSADRILKEFEQNGRHRDSAHCEMQKSAARKFHGLLKITQNRNKIASRGYRGGSVSASFADSSAGTLMTDYRNFRNVAPLLASVVILLAGQGLLVSLVQIRGAEEGFSERTLALIGSLNALGMLVACFAVPWIIRRTGHFVAFCMFALAAAATAVAYALLVIPIFWMIVRVVTGFCFSSLDVTCETWFHANAKNENRGQLIGVYGTMRYLGRGLGQFLLGIVNSTSFTVRACDCCACPCGRTSCD